MRGVVQFEVWGEPAPQGSKSFKGISKQTGHAILAESSKKVRPWRDQVAFMARAHLNRTYTRWEPITGPVHLVVEFAMPRPVSAPKTRRTLPATKPDLSKLLRSTEDALTTAGVWGDDGQVVDVTMRERYVATDSRVTAPGDLEHVGARITVIPVAAADTLWEEDLAGQVIALYEQSSQAA